MTPLITIFVRHSAGCKYAADEFARRCSCRKHLRWSAGGVQHRRQAGTRSWAEAEEAKRALEDELAGRPAPTGQVRPIRDAAKVFIQDKRVQGVSGDVIAKYTRELERLADYAEKHKAHTVQRLTRELLTGYAATWEELYPSTVTRSKVRERLRGFLRYCYEAQWLDRVIPLPTIKVDEPETQPLTAAEYARLLAAVPVVVRRGDPRRRTERNSGRRGFTEEDALVRKVRAFFQCMRWTGLAIQDSLTLPRSALAQTSTGLYRVTARRCKTGTPVSNAIPPEVAEELLAVSNSNPKFFFWTGEGKPQSATTNWGQRYVAPVFKEAGIRSEGFMRSHRLRDTFAVHLLEHGAMMDDVSKLLGHTSIRTTERHYARWSRGRQDRLDGIVAASWTGAAM